MAYSLKGYCRISIPTLSLKVAADSIKEPNFGERAGLADPSECLEKEERGM